MTPIRLITVTNPTPRKRKPRKGSKPRKGQTHTHKETPVKTKGKRRGTATAARRRARTAPRDSKGHFVKRRTATTAGHRRKRRAVRTNKVRRNKLVGVQHINSTGTSPRRRKPATRRHTRAAAPRRRTARRPVRRNAVTRTNSVRRRSYRRHTAANPTHRRRSYRNPMHRRRSYRNPMHRRRSRRNPIDVSFGSVMASMFFALLGFLVVRLALDLSDTIVVNIMRKSSNKGDSASRLNILYITRIIVAWVLMGVTYFWAFNRSGSAVGSDRMDAAKRSAWTGGALATFLATMEGITDIAFRDSPNSQTGNALKMVMRSNVDVLPATRMEVATGVTSSSTGGIPVSASRGIPFSAGARRNPIFIDPARSKGILVSAPGYSNKTSGGMGRWDRVIGPSNTSGWNNVLAPPHMTGNVRGTLTSGSLTQVMDSHVSMPSRTNPMGKRKNR